MSAKKKMLIHVMKLNSQSRLGATVEACSGNQKRMPAARPAATVSTAAKPEEIRMNRMASGLEALCFIGSPPDHASALAAARALRATTAFQVPVPAGAP